MRIFDAIRSVVSSVLRRGEVEAEVEEELRGHIRERADDLVRSGQPRAEAERRARLEFGGYQKFKEECRDEMSSRAVESLTEDIRYGARMLRKSPGFTAVAVLTLALGIGANTAIFSVVYAALLRPLPYVQPNRLLTLGEVRTQEELGSGLQVRNWNASYPDFLDWKQQSKAFQALAGFQQDAFVLHGAGEPRFVPSAAVTTNFFSTLGVRPFLGRDFVAGEDVRSGPKVAILTYGTWRTEFGGDPNVIGRSIQLDANSVTIVGVLPNQFEFGPTGNTEIWVPQHLSDDQATRRNLRWLPAIGRLAPGVTVAQAQAEMNQVTARLAAAYPQQDGAIRVLIAPLRDRIVGLVRPVLVLLFGAVGFVLLIACANVANLMMVRSSARRREFVIRAALGASRRRLASQLMAESFLLALVGGALGLFIARWGTVLLIGAIPKMMVDSMPFLHDAHLNAVVFAFLCAVVLLTAFAFGMAPAWQFSKQHVGDALKEEARTSAGGVRTRVRDALVVCEIAISLLLLVGAGLLVRSLAALLDRNPGFDAHNLLAFAVNLPDELYPKEEQGFRFDKQFRDRVRALPGVVDVTSTSVVPLSGGSNTIRFVIEGQPVAVGHENEAKIREVSSNYFSLMRIRLVSGRFFTDAEDSSTAPQHVIVNEEWVRRYSHGERALGKRIRFTFSATQKYREIVGVVGNNADAGLDTPDEPTLFLPFLQSPDSYIDYIVRTAGNPAVAISGIRAALREVDPRLAMIVAETMDQIISDSPSIFLRRYPSYLIGSFAVLALVLAIVGLYGLISYSVSQRTRELGIRMALGAQGRDVVRLVLSHGLRLALIGVGAGTIAALVLAQFLRTFLYGVRAVDPATFSGVVLLLAIVAAAACYAPARRAARTDPLVALRYE